MNFLSGGRTLILLGVFYVLSVYSAKAAVNLTVSENVAATNFVGEKFCFDLSMSNSGDEAYGPYYRLFLKPDFTLDSVTFLGGAISSNLVGVFAGAALITDPISGDSVAKPNGIKFYNFKLPVGSLVAGQPTLTAKVCVNIDSSAVVNLNQAAAVEVIPMLEFGDTPTGVNGSLTFPAITKDVEPVLVKYTVSHPEAESENPPGIEWKTTTIFKADIASDKTVGSLNFNSVLPYILPTNVKYISSSGGCTLSTTPSDLTLSATGGGQINSISCGPQSGTIGLSNDYNFNIDTYILGDALNLATCTPNGATLNTAKHLKIVKTASGGTVPGAIVTYIITFEASGELAGNGISSLNIVDTLNDGVTFNGTATLNYNGSSYSTIVTNSSKSGITGITTITFDEVVAEIAEPVIADGTSGTITYTATVDANYTAAPVEAVLGRDVIGSLVVGTYDIGGGNASSCTDDSSASVMIIAPTIVKTLKNPMPFYSPGDDVTFLLSMTIPSGDADNITIEDFFPLPIFDVTTISTNTNFSGGNPNISWEVGSDTLPVSSVTINTAKNSLKIILDNLSSGSSKTFIISVTAKVSTKPFADGLTLSNFMQGSTSDTPATVEATLARAELLIRAPKLTMIKTVESAGPTYEAGDVVDYKIVINNQGGADAYNLDVLDLTPSHLSNCTAPVLSAGTYTNSLYTASGLRLTGPLNAASTLEITYSCDVMKTVEIGTTITNTARVTWSADSTSITAFPSITDAVIINIPEPTVLQTLEATSETVITTGNDVTAGEIVRLRIKAKMPEGTHTNLELMGIIPTGFEYINDNTAKIGFVSHSNFTGHGVICGAGTLNISGDEATADALDPSCTVVPTNIGSIADGVDAIFNLGNLVNNDVDGTANDEFIILEYNVRTLATMSVGNIKNFSGRVRTGQYDVTSSSIAMVNREPSLTIVKTVTPITVDAGDTVTYLLTVTNSSASGIIPAKDLEIIDQVPSFLTYDTAGGSTVITCTGATTSLDASTPEAPNGLKFIIDTMAIGQTCTVSFKATAKTTVIPGTVITNTANLTYSNLVGPGALNGALGNVTGTDSGLEETYTASDNANITVAAPEAIHTIVSSDQSHTPYTVGDNTGTAHLVAIGEKVKFRFEVSVPEGTSPNFNITETLPAGLKYITGTMKVGLVSQGNLVSDIAICTGTILKAAQSDIPDCSYDGAVDENAIVLNFGNLTNTDSDGNKEYAIIEFEALVRNILVNQYGASLPNRYQVKLGATVLTTSPYRYLRVVEPEVDYTVSHSPASVDNLLNITPTVSWTLAVENLNNSSHASAFQIKTDGLNQWKFTLPAGLKTISNLSLNITGGDVYENGTTTVIALGDFVISGTDNRVLTLSKAMEIGKGGKITLTFDSIMEASVVPGITLNIFPHKMTYSSLPTGGVASDVRNGTNMTAGAGNKPVTGTSVPLNNYHIETAHAVPTVAENPVIGIAKRMTSGPTYDGNGNYAIGLEFKISNLGNVHLEDVQVTDDLEAVFGAGTAIVINSLTVSSGLTKNASYDGMTAGDINFLAAGNTLDVGESQTINLNITVTPKNNLGTFNNVANASAKSQRSTVTINDASHNGTNPDPESNGPADNNDVTPIILADGASLGTAKNLVSLTHNGSGVYTATYDILVQNTGDSNLTLLQVTDDLDAVFGSIASSDIVISELSSTDFTVNGAYNGFADKKLLAGTDSFSIGAAGTIRLKLILTPKVNIGPYNNSAVASARSPSSSGPAVLNVSDVSQDGSDPDLTTGGITPSDNSNSAAHNVPTPTNLVEKKGLGIAKDVISGPIHNGSNSYTVTFRITAHNGGDVNLKNLQLEDNIAVRFAGVTSFTIDSVTSSDFTVNGSYNGAADSNLLSGVDALNIGAGGTLDFTVTFNTGGAGGPYDNFVMGAAESPSAVSGTPNVTDQSTDGFDPDPDTAGNTPVDNPDSSDDLVPTTVQFGELSRIGLAMEVVSAPLSLGDGTYRYTYRLLVQNVGNVGLSSLKINYDLNTVLSGLVNYNLDSATSSDFTVNGSYNGNGVLALLTGTDALAAGAQGSIDLVITANPGTNLTTTYNTQAAITAESPANLFPGTPNVFDTSTNGNDTDPDTPGLGAADNVNPTNNSVLTPVTFSEDAELALAKVSAGVINVGDGTYTFDYIFKLKNSGTVNLANLQITDDLTAAFTAADSFSVTGISSADIAVNASFNGASDKNMIAAGTAFAVGAEANITVSIVTTPGTALGTFNNQAAASASSPANPVPATPNVSDLSTNGTDPDPENNGSADNSLVTPVILTESPVIGAAKRVVSQNNNLDGTYNVTYEIRVQNSGDILLKNIQLVEDLSLSFAAADAFAVLSLSSSDFTVNNSFNGVSDKNMLAVGNSLTKNAQGTVTLKVVITPGVNLGFFDNFVTAQGETPSAVIGTPNVSDVSTDGNDPDPDTAGNLPSDNINPSDNQDKTRVTLNEVPVLGLALRVVSSDNLGDGTYRVTYEMFVQNSGDIHLDHLQIKDPLATIFPNFSKIEVTSVSSNDFTVNAAYNGQSDDKILSGSDALLKSASGHVTMVVIVTPDAHLGTYNNTATVYAESPAATAGTPNVLDVSTDGTDPDPDSIGNGAVDNTNPSDNSVPSPVSFTEVAKVGLAKASRETPSRNSDGTFNVIYDFTIQNMGDVELRKLQITDDLSSSFAGAKSFEVISITSGDVAVNSSYNGDTDKNLLIGTESFGRGKTAVITLKLKIHPGTNFIPYLNRAVVSGFSPAANDPQNPNITDKSTDGYDTDPDTAGRAPSDNGNPNDNEVPTVINFPAGAVVGNIYEDLNLNSESNIAEGFGSVDVKLYAAGTDGVFRTDDDILLQETTSDDKGDYEFRSLNTTDVLVVIEGPDNGRYNGSARGLSLIFGDEVRADFPFIDPAGIIYNSLSREPIEGATVNIYQDVNANKIFDAGDILSYTKITGADGKYAWALAGADNYVIEVIPPSDEYSFVSQFVPPTDAPDPLPDSLNDMDGIISQKYYLAFRFVATSGDLINNDIPLDPPSSTAILMKKETSKRDVSVGDLVPYVVTAENTISAIVPNVMMSDTLPAGFKMAQGSARKITAGNDNIFGTADDVMTKINTSGSRVINFDLITFAPKEIIKLRYILRVGTGVIKGSYENAVMPSIRGRRVGNAAKVSVDVVGDKMLDQTTIIGKVFHDRDGDGYQDSATAKKVTLTYGSTVIDMGTIAPRLSVNDNFEGSSKQAVISGTDYKGDFTVATDEGTRITLHSNGEISTDHNGFKARGATAQDIVIKRSTAQGNTIITVINKGISEEGIPGVRLATVEGLLVETDAFGRYHIADVETGKYERGRNFIVKVDDSTLPYGAVFTTENPRVVRLTKSLMTKFNFGVKFENMKAVAAQRNFAKAPVLTDKTSASVAVEGAASYVLSNELYPHSQSAQGGIKVPMTSNDNQAPVMIDGVMNSDDVKSYEVPNNWRLKMENGGVIWANEDPSLIKSRLNVSGPSSLIVKNGKIEGDAEFKIYSNYGAFITEWELAVYSVHDSDMINPIAHKSGFEINSGEVISLGNLRSDLSDAENTSKYFQVQDNLYYVLRVKDSAGNIDVTAPHLIRLISEKEDLARGFKQDKDKIKGLADYGIDTVSKHNIPLYGSRIRIRGHGVAKGSTVSVNGEEIPVGPKGAFIAEQILPIGHHKMKVDVTNEEGEVWTKIPELNVTGEHFFMVGIADFTVSKMKVTGDKAITDRDSHYQPETHLDGRTAFYLKGKIQGKYLITAQFDSKEDRMGNFLKNIMDKDPRALFRRLDANKFYPVYGDGSVTKDDTNSQSKFYIRVDFDKSVALYGNFNSDFTGTELATYNRSLHGLKLLYRDTEVTKYSQEKMNVSLFVSEPNAQYAHNEFLGTGGSLYYLKHSDIVQGSEKIQVELRASLSGRVIDKITLEAGRDYSIDSFQGRIILNRPLSHVMRNVTAPLIRDQALDGHQTVMVIDYEYLSREFEGGKVGFGLRAKSWLYDQFALGGTYVKENREGEDYELKALDATYQAGKGTYVSIEAAETKAKQAVTSLYSTDGGLSFGKLGKDISQDHSGRAVSIEGRANMRELTGMNAVIVAWFKDRKAGYSTASRETKVDTVEYGIEATSNPAPDISISLRAAVLDQKTLFKDQSITANVEKRFDDSLNLSGEIKYVSEKPFGQNTRTGTLAAVKLGYKVNERAKAYAVGQASVISSGAYEKNNRVTLGGSYKFEDLTVLGETSVGSRGNASTIGADYRISSDHSLYANYSLSPDRSEMMQQGGKMIGFGGRSILSNKLSTYSENQFLETERQTGLTNVIGFDYLIAEGWTTGFSAQYGTLTQVGGSSAGDVTERSALSFSARYSSALVNYSSRLEIRRDRGNNEKDLRQVQWLTTNKFDVALRQNLTLHAGLDHSKTTDKKTGKIAASFMEFSMGFAYRPVFNDDLNILGKYSYLYDLPSVEQSISRFDERGHVFAVEALYDINKYFSLGGKLAHKFREMRTDRDAGAWFDNDVSLFAVRGRFHVISKWDVMVEYHWLKSNSSGDDKSGAMVGLYRHVGEHMKVGVGYNFTDFDDDLTSRDYNAKGWFINIIGKY